MTDAATIAIVIGVGVVAMIVVVRWIRWPMLRIAMLAAIPLISVRGWSWTSADSLDHSDTAVQQVYLVDATLAAFGVAMLPARLVGRRPFLLTRWLTVGGVVLACAIFVHVLLSIDIALWRMWASASSPLTLYKARLSHAASTSGARPSCCWRSCWPAPMRSRLFTLR